MSESEAIAMADSKWWESTTLEKAAMFQLFEERLVMPFAKFHEGIEKLLGRPVWTHEFAFAKKPGGLQEEAQLKCQPPSMQEILNLIPAEKRIVVSIPETT